MAHLGLTSTQTTFCCPPNLPIMITDLPKLWQSIESKGTTHTLGSSHLRIFHSQTPSGQRLHQILHFVVELVPPFWMQQVSKPTLLFVQFIIRDTPFTLFLHLRTNQPESKAANHDTLFIYGNYTHALSLWSGGKVAFAMCSLFFARGTWSMLLLISNQQNFTAAITKLPSLMYPSLFEGQIRLDFHTFRAADHNFFISCSYDSHSFPWSGRYAMKFPCIQILARVPDHVRIFSRFLPCNIWTQKRQSSKKNMSVTNSLASLSQSMNQGMYWGRHDHRSFLRDRFINF